MRTNDKIDTHSKQNSITDKYIRNEINKSLAKTTNL